jgi:alpha-galactosidase
MMGKMGFDIVVDKLSPNDLKFAKDAVQTYNSLKQTVWQGDQYRLADPRENSVASVMYVDSAKASAVMFNYLVNYRYDQGSKLPVRLKGLDPAKKYRVEDVNLYPGTEAVVKSQDVYPGDFLMKVGINPKVDAGHSSVVLKITEAGK